MARILLIDDDRDVRDSIAKVLVREGYEVTTAASAKKGLDILAKKQIDVLIADLIMPGTDGVLAIRQVRQSNTDIKILAISGGGNFGPKAYKPEAITTTAYLQAATDAGADRVLTKPFERVDVVESVRLLMKSDRG